VPVPVEVGEGRRRVLLLVEGAADVDGDPIDPGIVAAQEATRSVVQPDLGPGPADAGGAGG
jgi:hypothetical protein